MDPREILLVIFHFGGEFIKVGPNLDYVGGDDALSEIERKKLPLQEVKGFVKDHMASKETIKLYFLILWKDLVDGLVLLYDDTGYVEMAHYVRPGRVADVYIEYHGEEDSKHSSIRFSFKDEVWEVSDGEEEPDVVVITAVKPAKYETRCCPLRQKKSFNKRP